MDWAKGFAALAEAAGLTPAAAYCGMAEVLGRDAESTLAAVQLVSAQKWVSSQLIDNLNASIHFRALLTDLFLIDEILDIQDAARGRQYVRTRHSYALAGLIALACGGGAAPMPQMATDPPAPERPDPVMEAETPAPPAPPAATAAPPAVAGLDTVRAGRFDNGRMWTFENPPSAYLRDDVRHRR